MIFQLLDDEHNDKKLMFVIDITSRVYHDLIL